MIKIGIDPLRTNSTRIGRALKELGANKTREGRVYGYTGMTKKEQPKLEIDF